MKQDNHPKQQLPAPASNHVRSRLFYGIITMLLLIVATGLTLPLVLNSDSIKQKIQTAVAEQTDGQVTFQTIGLSYFPRPAVELNDVTVAVPNRAQGTVAALRVAPKIISLLAGKFQLARLELDTPQLSLDLPEIKANKAPAPLYTFATVEKSLTKTLEPFTPMISGLKLQINEARLTISQNKQKLVEIEGLNLQGGVSTTSPPSAQVNLQAKVSALNIYRGDHQEMIKNINLRGNVKMIPSDRIAFTLDRLALAEPNLELKGSLALASTEPAIALKLSGKDIDADAVRKTVLALAGDTTPIKEIFDYLRGGRVPQISFSSHGKNLDELGDLNNILIEGQLQDGKVSIPNIKLDLTEVTGDVTISNGVLQGNRLSARLENSLGREGSLKIGLPKGNDLFQLELLVDADLAQTQPILQRIIDNPTFVAELKKITNLQGTAHGWLTLGDDLNDINAKVDASDVNLSATSQRAPWPITITKGQFAFNKAEIDLRKLSGTLGQSHFDELSCQFLWKNDLSLHITSGKLHAAMAELFPWLASMEGVREKLKDIKQVTGQLDVSAIEIQGAFNKPSEWKFASTGTVKDLFVNTSMLPDTVTFESGQFNVDRKQFTFNKLRTANQDAVLTLTGKLNGFPPQLEGIELSVDGRMGPQSLEWLSNALKVPKSYELHAPISISTANISWQPDAMASFNGAISIEKGPTITADVDYYPEQLQLHQLTIKDQYSNANISYTRNKNQRDLKYSGNLERETLQALFVDSQFSGGRLEGDFAVTVPQDGKSGVTTKGQLIGENLPIPISSVDMVNIDKITLKADSQQVNVDITKLTWKKLTWEPVNARISFNKNSTDIRFAKAKLCGIDSPGIFSISGKTFYFDMTLEGTGLNVATSYSCLTDNQVKMTGTLDFSSHVTASGQLNELVDSLKGPLEMNFSNGLIERDKLLSRTLEVLNVTEIVKGRLPNLATKGLAYTTMTLQGEFRNGNLLINNYFMDGETLDLVGNGKIHLQEETVDVQLLAAPFKTADTIVRNIPGVNYLLAGSLVTIPVSISGNLADPKVEVMSVSAIGSSLYNLAKRTIKSPFKLLELINPWKKKDEK